MSREVECPVCRGAPLVGGCAYCAGTTLPSGVELLSILQRVSSQRLEVVGQVRLSPGFHARYRLDHQLGAGASGAVWLATDLTHRRAVAIKFLMHTAPEMAARFRREGQILARVRHPNVLAVYDFDEEDGRPFLVTEYLDAGSLRSRLDPKGLPLARVLGWIAPLLEGLQACHDVGIVHRDIKPDNVMFGADQTPRLVDMGLSAIAGDPGGLTVAGALIGTPRYFAPEVIQGHQIGPPADLYAMGVMLFEMFSGRAPFTDPALPALMKLHVEAPVPRLDKLTPVSVEVARCVAHALAKRPEERPASARAFAEELAAAARPAPRARPLTPTTPAQATRAPSPPARRSRAPLVAGLVALALVAGLLAFRFGRRAAQDGDDARDARCLRYSLGNNFTAGRREADAWLAAAPGNHDALIWRARFLSAQGEHVEAEQVLAALPSPSAMDVGLLAHEQAIQLHLEDAERTIQRAYLLDPNSYHNFEIHGIIRRYQARYDEAEKLLIRAIELSPVDAGPCGHLASLLLGLRRAEDADRWARRGLALQAENTWLVHLHSAALRQLGRRPEAEQVLVGYLARHPIAPTEAWLLALLYAERMAMDEAQRLAPRLCEADRLHLPGMLAAEYQMQGHGELAIALTVQAHELAPGDSYSAAAASFAAGQPSLGTTPDNAAAALLATKPRTWIALLAVGRLYEIAQQYDKATTYFLEATRQHDGRHMPHFVYARFLDRRLLLPEARQQYQLALELDPSDVSTRMLYALLLQRLSKSRRALDLLEAIEPARRTGEIHDRMGRLQEDLENWPAAEREYRAAIGAGYNGPDQQLRLAGVLQKLGRDDEAAHHISRAPLTEDSHSHHGPTSVNAVANTSETTPRVTR